MNSRPIFISHAAVDKPIADVVVDILNTAMGIDVQKDVFCTSLEGMKIPPGEDFKHFVHEQIQKPKIVVLLISQNYLASQFCLAEAGAAWAMSHRVIPFIIPPTTYDDMKAIFANTQVLKIGESSDWNEALEIFKNELSIQPNSNRWERKRDELLKTLKAKIKKQPSPSIVSSNKFNEVQEKLTDANKEIEELEVELTSERAIISELKKLKDSEQVAQVELTNLPAAEAIETLTDECSSTLQSLPSSVQDAIFYYNRGESLPTPKRGYSDSEEQWHDIQEAEENGFLRVSDDSIDVNDESPLVKEAIANIEKINDFMSENENLSDSYELRNKHQFDTRNRQFWNSNF